MCGPLLESVARTGKLLVVEEGDGAFDLGERGHRRGRAGLPRQAAACTCAASPREPRPIPSALALEPRCCRAMQRCAPRAWSSSMSEPIAVLVPQINPNDEHAVVVRWHVENGARVERARRS